MRIQLNITLKCSIINELIIKKRIYLNAKKRYNIIQKNNENDETIEITREVKLFFHFFVFSFSR